MKRFLILGLVVLSFGLVGCEAGMRSGYSATECRSRLGAIGDGDDLAALGPIGARDDLAVLGAEVLDSVEDSAIGKKRFRIIIKREILQEPQMRSSYAVSHGVNFFGGRGVYRFRVWNRFSKFPDSYSVVVKVGEDEGGALIWLGVECVSDGGLNEKLHGSKVADRSSDFVRKRFVEYLKIVEE